jgi:hypothetical protein
VDFANVETLTRIPPPLNAGPLRRNTTQLPQSSHRRSCKAEPRPCGHSVPKKREVLVGIL